MKNRSNEQIYQSISQLKYLSLAGLLLFLVFCGFVILERNTESFEDTARYQPPPESLESDTSKESDLRPIHPVRGQTVYVPAYSHIYHENGAPILLAVTLSIRNTSLDHDVFVESVKYHNTSGQELKSYLKKPIRLGPLATTEFLVEQDDTTGGSGANFVVQWASDKPISNPVIEAVMDRHEQTARNFVCTQRCAGSRD